MFTFIIFHDYILLEKFMSAIWGKFWISWSRHWNKIKNTYSYKETFKNFPTSECIDPEFFQSENVNPTILRFHAIKLFVTQIEKDCSCSFKQGRLTFTAFSFIRAILPFFYFSFISIFYRSVRTVYQEHFQVLLSVRGEKLLPQ